MKNLTMIPAQKHRSIVMPTLGYAASDTTGLSGRGVVVCTGIDVPVRAKAAAFAAGTGHQVWSPPIS